MSAMTATQAKAIIQQVTGYSVEEKPTVALDMAQRIARDITEAIETLGGVPPVVPLEPADDTHLTRFGLRRYTQ